MCAHPSPAALPKPLFRLPAGLQLPGVVVNRDLVLSALQIVPCLPCPGPREGGPFVPTLRDKHPELRMAV